MSLLFLMLWGNVMTASDCDVGEHHDNNRITIQAQEGETADLPFYFGDINLENETFDLQRVDGNFTDSNKFIYSRRNGEENFEPQSKLYEDRVFLNSTSLNKGMVVLKILSVNLSDSGEYLLTLPKLKETQSQMTQRVVLVVNKPEMKNKSSDGFNSTTSERPKDKGEAKERHRWFDVIPVSLFIVIIAGLIIKSSNICSFIRTGD